MSNETKKPITEADVKVGQVWVCGLATCEHRRRVDGISGGRVRTTWLSPRVGCDSVEMAEFIAYLNRDPASSLSTPGTGATDGLEARVSKVEGVLARICPEADEQTDGKGRTLVQIDREISDLCEIAQVTARRVTNLERLSAAHVPVPAKVHVRSDAASTNEAATEAAAVDEGWREMLVPVTLDGSDRVWWRTPDGKCFTNVDSPGPHALTWIVHKDRTEPVPAKFIEFRNTLPPPPNLAEWYKPVAKTTTESGDDAAHRFAKALVAASDAVPPTYRVGDDLAAWVRNLASAHDTALKVNAELSGHIGTMRGQLAAAQTATVAAEGRAETARRHAADAEAKLAALRADIENVRASLGK